MTGNELVTRRHLMSILAAAGLGSSITNSSRLYGLQGYGDWIKYSGNPVLGGEYGTCFDICVLRESGKFKMWVSWRPKQSVAITESEDGIHWNATEIVLGPRPESG